MWYSFAMTTIFPCSGDPITKAHYNIKEKWSKKFAQEVHFCLCQNPLKTEGLLTLSQRQKDLIISILTYRIESIDYSLNLLDKIGNPNWIKKRIPIDQDEIYKNISSTKYKIAYANISEKIASFPKIYSFLDKELIDKKCHERKEWKNIHHNESKILENNIMDYFWLVSDLQRKWRYKDISWKNI